MKKKKFSLFVLPLLSFALISCDSTSTSQPTPPTSDVVEERALLKLDVVSNPTKLVYEEGEMLDLTGLKVDAVYSDDTREDVTSKCTTNLDGKVLTSKNTSFFVIYRYEIDGKTKTKSTSINITVHAEEVIRPTIEKDLVATPDLFPHNLVKTSKAKHLFYSYYDSSSMKNEAVLELNDTSATEGTFRFVEMNGIAFGKEKVGVITGDYVIKDNMITMQSRLVKVTDNTNKYDLATKEVGYITKDGDKITAIDLGSMAGENKLWGWSKSKESAFVESIATSYGGNVYECYFIAVENNALSEDMKTYYEVNSLLLSDNSDLKTSYYVGEALSYSVLEIVVNYKSSVGYSQTLLNNSNVTYSLPLGHVMTKDDTSLDINYDGAKLTVPLTIKDIPAVKEVKAIRADTTNAKMSYTIGETFDTDGLVVKAVYTDGSEEVITDYTIDDKTPLTPLDDSAENMSTSLEISYTKDEAVFKTNIDVALSFVEPWNIGMNSKTPYLFVDYNKISKVKESYTSLELNGDSSRGTFIATIRFTTNNWKPGKSGASSNNYFIYRGDYTIADQVLQMTPTFQYTDKASTTMFYNPSKSNVTLAEGSHFKAAVEGELAKLTFDCNDTSVKLSDNTTAHPFFGLSTAVNMTLTRVIDNTLNSEQTDAIPY